jgi:hypothetical protein
MLYVRSGGLEGGLGRGQHRGSDFVCGVFYGSVSDGFWFLFDGSSFVFRMGVVGSGFVGGWEFLDLL